jgi:HSP20 family protein
MASTGTQPSKTQETTEQSGTSQSGSATTGGAQQTTSTSGASQPSGTSQQTGGTGAQAGQTGTSQSPQQSQQRGGNLARTSGQGQGIAQRGSFGPSYWPSTAEFFSNPFAVMRRMHEDMDRAFAEAFGGGTASSSGAQDAWSPAIDVSERQGNLVVHAELPGIKPEDVQLEVDNDTLVLSGRRERSEDHEEKGVHRRERMYGSFYRAIPLPEGTDTEKARAQFNNGVLEVTIPLPQRQSQSRRIPIGGEKS